MDLTLLLLIVCSAQILLVGTIEYALGLWRWRDLWVPDPREIPAWWR